MSARSFVQDWRDHVVRPVLSHSHRESDFPNKYFPTTLYRQLSQIESSSKIEYKFELEPIGQACRYCYWRRHSWWPTMRLFFKANGRIWIVFYIRVFIVPLSVVLNFMPAFPQVGLACLLILTSFLIDSLQPENLQPDPAQQALYDHQQSVAMLAHISQQLASIRVAPNFHPISIKGFTHRYQTSE
jgi:hypothetical protein